jgi:hypothetical protein
MYGAENTPLARPEIFTNFCLPFLFILRFLLPLFIGSENAPRNPTVKLAVWVNEALPFFGKRIVKEDKNHQRLNMIEVFSFNIGISHW